MNLTFSFGDDADPSMLINSIADYCVEVRLADGNKIDIEVGCFGYDDDLNEVLAGFLWDEDAGHGDPDEPIKFRLAQIKEIHIY